MISRDKMKLLEGVGYEKKLIHSHPISTESNKVHFKSLIPSKCNQILDETLGG